MVRLHLYATAEEVYNYLGNVKAKALSYLLLRLEKLLYFLFSESFARVLDRDRQLVRFFLVVNLHDYYFAVSGEVDCVLDDVPHDLQSSIPI